MRLTPSGGAVDCSRGRWNFCAGRILGDRGQLIALTYQLVKLGAKAANKRLKKSLRIVEPIVLVHRLMDEWASKTSKFHSPRSALPPPDPPRRSKRPARPPHRAGFALFSAQIG